MKQTIETLSAGYPANVVRSALAALTLQPAPAVRIGMDWGALAKPKFGPVNPKIELSPKAKRAPRSKTKHFAYRIGTPFRGRGGTWTSHMVLTMQRHTRTQDAEMEHRNSDQFVGKRLHWAWAVEKGYIVEVAP